MKLIKRKPWILVLLFYLSFIALWVWFAWFAMQHSPEVIPLPPVSQQH